MTQIEPKSLQTFFSPYLSCFEDELRVAIEQMGPPSELKEACAYALQSGGKRFRPALVLMIADAIGRKEDAFGAALAVEFFHTASLVADDLPCMDNDDFRRNQPSLHIKYNEATALLVSYALISEGYKAITDNSPSDAICRLSLENVSFNTGIRGATGGQYWDILPPDDSEETVRKVIHMKTVTLFEIAFVLGWLFGGGDQLLLEVVKKAAHSFGLAFQIADDLVDMDQDRLHKQNVNTALLYGRERAKKMFHVETKRFQDCLIRLGLQNSPLTYFCEHFLSID